MSSLPGPVLTHGHYMPLKGLRVLLLCNSVNSLTNRIRLRLHNRQAVVNLAATKCPETMEYLAQKYTPDLIICPFLTARIPPSLYSTPDRPTLVVHPGIAGDRGASSIDWALHDGEETWGATVLEAAEEVDAGNIWSTSDFKVDKNSTKTSLYVGAVSDAAEICVMDAISRYMENVPSFPLQETHAEIKGRLRPNMKKSNREVSWEMSAEKAANIVRMSDTLPGAVGQIQSRDSKVFQVRLFDGHVESGCKSELLRDHLERYRPGQVVGQKDGAILIKTGDEKGVWIGQMRRDVKFRTVKLPAVTLLRSLGFTDELVELDLPADYRDLWVETDGPICKVHFDFYNGGMTPEQGLRLESTLKAISCREDIKVVAFMGGDRFYSTGINLCTIEASLNTEQEAMRNIHQINDVIKAMFSMKNKLTVAVLQGNAGAGGAMMAAAADFVVTHPGVLLTPSYKSMSLTGSEYWTHFLPKRVGNVMAHQLVEMEGPILAETANNIGLVDTILGRNKQEFLEELPSFLSQMLYGGYAEKIIREKRSRDSDWYMKLETIRFKELEQMKADFASVAFNSALKQFLYHTHGEDNRFYSHFERQVPDSPIRMIAQNPEEINIRNPN